MAARGSWLVVPDAGVVPATPMEAGTRGAPGATVVPAARMMTPVAGAVMTSVTTVVAGAATSVPGMGQDGGCARANTGNGHG